MDHKDDLGGIDRRILSALRARGADPRVAGAARALSWAGEHGALWLAAGLAGAAVDGGRRHAWLRATALTAGAHVASMGVKRIVRRPRRRSRASWGRSASRPCAPGVRHGRGAAGARSVSRPCSRRARPR